MNFYSVRVREGLTVRNKPSGYSITILISPNRMCDDFVGDDRGVDVCVCVFVCVCVCV